MKARIMDAATMGEDVDLGGGFVLFAEPGRDSIIVATALADTGALGFASPASVDGRLDADALAWLAKSGLLGTRRLRSLAQVHGTTCVAGAQCTSMPEADAVWTDSAEDMLIIRTADCAAMWLVDPERRLLAMLHVGWRGAADGIIPRTIEELRAHGAENSSLVAAIGPHIGPCCLEVGPEVADRFAHIAGAVSQASVLTATRQRSDSASLNLGAVLLAQLRDARIPAGAIHMATACSRCFRVGDGTAVLHSYRRNGKGGPLMASVGFLER